MVTDSPGLACTLTIKLCGAFACRTKRHTFDIFARLPARFVDSPFTRQQEVSSAQTVSPPSRATSGAQQTESVSGSIERVTFHSENSGFCVLRVKVRGHRELITVVGEAGSVSAGEFIDCEGLWINDTKHGMQFKCRRLTVVPPSTVDGIEKYLGSGMIKGIGPHFAKQLVKAFGMEVFEVIENAPSKMLELPGIGQRRMEGVIAGWTEQKAVREIMVFLQSYGVGTSRAVRIYKTYGNEAVAKVTENPYRLALEINGIGFKTADALALKLGISRQSPKRAAAGLRHMLQELSKRGHCACTEQALVDTTAEALEIESQIVEEALQGEKSNANVICEERRGENWIFLPALHRAEQGVARQLVRLARGAAAAEDLDPDVLIPQVEKETSLKLSDSQREAVTTALSSKLLVITGGPGVGKTTIVNTILKIISSKEATVLLCAPTGRAAKRLSESTSLEAKTIHRLLEFDPRQGGFKRNQENPLEADLVVIDESSMIDVTLMYQLLRAIPSEASVLFVGDVDQLPSVGPGSVLSDLILSEKLPVVRLTEIFRQAASSKIIVNAHRINHGEMPLSAEKKDELSDFYFIACETPEEIVSKMMQVICKRIPERFGLDPLHDVQVLAPLNRGGLGSRALNVELQKRLNRTQENGITRFGWNYKVGDKVIQTQNNYDKDVFNGDIGTILAVDIDENKLAIVFEGREVEYDVSDLDELLPAYAVSIHKSQGSEYPAVVIPLAMQHFMMLERNLLYTGVTRGKKLVVVIGQRKALTMAVNNVRSSTRLTALKERIQEMFEEAF